MKYPGVRTCWQEANGASTSFCTCHCLINKFPLETSTIGGIEPDNIGGRPRVHQAILAFSSRAKPSSSLVIALISRGVQFEMKLFIQFSK